MLPPELVVMVSFFGSIFGIYYLYITSRNKERLALIEKGADASIFFSTKKQVTPIWKVLILNLAVLLMGIGFGIFMAGILHHTLGVEEEIAFPGTIFFCAGSGLLVGFYLTRKLITKEV